MTSYARMLLLTGAVTYAVVTSPYLGARQAAQAPLTPTPTSQTPATPTGPPKAAWPTIDRARSTDWALNNYDPGNSRFVPLEQITSANVGTLAVRWLRHTRGNGGTPIVVDGVMYAVTQEGTEALDAATGRVIWENSRVTAMRGVVYGDGKVYVATRTGSLWALDARTGEPVRSFGNGGVSDVLMDVLKTRHPTIARAADLGYSVTMTPQYYKGTLILATGNSDQNIPGGWVLAVDGSTGRLKWKFNGIPQGPDDEGWEIAKDTWVGGVRNGGGVWQTPAVDADLGMVHVVIGNPYPSHDGSARKGDNLFTLCFVALDLNTGRLKWYFQQVHHDLWDLDSGQQPTLFDIQVKGRTVKALAAGSKSGYVYILDRATGKPVNPIVEMPVDAVADLPGESPSPTQPIPHTASGKVMQPMAGQEIKGVYPGFERFPQVPLFTPPRRSGAVHAPREGVHYGTSSFSPKTRMLYVAGKELPIYMTVTPIGANGEPGKMELAGLRVSAAPETGNLVAINPASGEIAWRTPLTGGPSTGTLVTAGNVVFAADRSGMFYAVDATTGRMLWQFDTGGAIRAGQITYEVNGTQYVTVVSGGDVILTFALPRAPR